MDAQRTIARKALQLITDQRNLLSDAARYFKLGSLHLVQHQYRTINYTAMQLNKNTLRYLTQKRMELQSPTQTLSIAARSTWKNHASRLAEAEKIIQLLDPQQVLNRGYSITRVNGRALKSTGDVRRGDVIQTVLASGTMTSTINEIKKSET